MSAPSLSRCVFCEIVAGRSPASVIFQDEIVMALMTLHPTSPGECMVIPKAHVDQFVDLDDATAQRVMVVAQRIVRRMQQIFQPQRVGMVVHGFGVPHAHFLLVPQHHPDDITSGRFAYLDNGKIRFGLRNIPAVDREVLDEHARLLRIESLGLPE
jgi:histidine triad (HIT) family protein